MLTVTEYQFWGAPAYPNSGGPRHQLASTSLAPAAAAAPICTLSADTRFIVVASSVDARVSLVGAADASSQPVFAKVPQVIAVKGGETVSIITF